MEIATDEWRTCELPFSTQRDLELFGLDTPSNFDLFLQSVYEDGFEETKVQDEAIKSNGGPAAMTTGGWHKRDFGIQCLSNLV